MHPWTNVFVLFFRDQGYKRQTATHHRIESQPLRGRITSNTSNWLAAQVIVRRLAQFYTIGRHGNANGIM